MSFGADIRDVSDSAIDRLADRFDGLPRPLLAAIGAGDFAVEQLAALRENLVEQLAAGAQQPVDLRAATEYVGKAQQAAGDLPHRAQQIAAEVADSVQGFATQIPARAQELVAGLPAKVAEFRGDLSVETVRDTVEAYTQLVGSIYGILADRGDRSWSRVRSSSLRPGTVVDAKPEPPTATSTPEATASPG